MSESRFDFVVRILFQIKFGGFDFVVRILFQIKFGGFDFVVRILFQIKCRSCAVCSVGCVYPSTLNLPAAM